MAIKVGLLLIFFSVMVGIGLYCRRHATNVNGFVLGGRSVGRGSLPLPMAPATSPLWSL